MSERSSRYSITRYLSVQSANAPTLSSDGRRLAFVSTITGIPQLWEIRFPRGSTTPPWPDQLTFGVDRVEQAYFSPAPGDGRLIYARDVGGDENSQFFLLAPDGEETALTAGHEEARHNFGEWSADGRSFSFVANRRDPSIFDLYVQSPDGEARLVWQNDTPGYMGALVFSPDGKRIALVRGRAPFEHDLFEIDLETGRARPVHPEDEPARYDDVCYDADGRHLLVNTDYHSDFLYVGRLDPATKQIEPLIALDHDVEHLACSPDKRYLAYTVNVDGNSELQLFELRTGTIRRAPRFSTPGMIAMMDGYITFSPDSTRLAFSFASATQTSDIYTWELEEDRVQAATRSSHAGLPRESFVAPELIHYPTFDGRQIPAWFFKPRRESGGPAPVIVYVHGGPESQSRPYFLPIVQYFSQHGYAVLAPNVRGSTGYGKAYSHLDDVEKRLDSVADLAYAARWLREQPGIDGKKIVVYGGSYGGYMVLAALAFHPNLWAAGIDIVGISSLVTFLENTSSYRRSYREAEYGSLARDRAFLERASPINHLEQITAPLMIIHGANDPRVPLGEAEQMAAALRARNVPVELMVFGDEGHGLVKLANKLAAYPAVVEFLEKHGVG